MDNGEIRARLLSALARHRKWGESHTAFENLFHYFQFQPLGKAGLKSAKKIAYDLMRDGFILQKPTHYGLQVSLNPRKAQEIKQLMKEKLGLEL